MENNKINSNREKVQRRNSKEYIEISKKMDSWPSWKKNSFNLNFATSAHAIKIL